MNSYTISEYKKQEAAMNQDKIIKGYEYALEVFSEQGIDIESAMKITDGIAVSMHCWQGDDVIGFDGSDEVGDGLAVTGDYPGRARTPEELRQDLEKAMSMIPGEKRLNLHACYGENIPKGIERQSAVNGNNPMIKPICQFNIPRSCK